MASFSSFENLQKDSINNASTKLMAEGKDKKKIIWYTVKNLFVPEKRKNYTFQR